MLRLPFPSQASTKQIKSLIRSARWIQLQLNVVRESCGFVFFLGQLRGSSVYEVAIGPGVYFASDANAVIN